ncbi:MAG TPA: SDR family oxidoreductase [Pseudonocardiaceae bacterium]
MRSPDQPAATPDPGAGVRGPLSGRVAVVTGGGRGIGAATSRRLATLGAHVVATYRHDRGSAEELASAIIVAGGSAEIEALDIADTSQVHGLVERLLARHGHVDVLVCNANAAFRRAPLAELDADDIAGPVAVNLRAAHILTTSLVEGMRASGWGRLIYVGSRHAQGPSAPGMAVNGTAKAALAGYLRYVVDECATGGVTANIVSPGMVDTDASRGIGLPDRVIRLLVAATPSGRITQPDEVAEAIALLVTAGDLLNGIDLPVTGGLNHPLPLTRLLPYASPPPINH